jgi:hypothetical protein
MSGSEWSLGDVQRCFIQRAIRTIPASAYITGAQSANGPDGETCNGCAIPQA